MTENTEPMTTQDADQLAQTVLILGCLDAVALDAAMKIFCEEARMGAQFTEESIVSGGKIYEVVKEAYLAEAARRKFDASKYVHDVVKSAIYRVLNHIAQAYAARVGN